MENPLTKEQISEIKRIQDLTGEEQVKEWEEFVKTLSKEQYEFLFKKQETGDKCFFCELIKGDIKKYIVYEDNSVLAILDINPANIGHTLVIPKEHFSFSHEIKDAGYYFNIANSIARNIKEKLKMDSNILVMNGENAGQKGNHFMIHVIPREKDDKISIAWDKKNAEEKELEKTKNLLKIIVEEKKPEKIIIESEKKERRVP